MIRGPRSRRSARIHVIGIFLPPVIAVPILNPGEPRPDRVDRVIQVRPVPAELAGKKRGSATRVHQPARGHGTFAAVHSYAQCLTTGAGKIALRYLGWAPQIASGPNRTFEHVR